MYFFCLGYANEVGEAFRPSINVNWVRLSYGIASAYVLADTVDKTLKMSKVCTFFGNKNLFVVVLTDYNSVTFIWNFFCACLFHSVHL